MLEIEEAELLALRQKARAWDEIDPLLLELANMTETGEIAAAAGELLIAAAIREIRLRRADGVPVTIAGVGFDAVATTSFSIMMNEIRVGLTKETALHPHQVRYGAYRTALQAAMPSLMAAARSHAFTTICQSIDERCATLQAGVDAAAALRKRESVIAGIGSIEALSSLRMGINNLSNGAPMAAIPPPPSGNALN